MSKVRLFTTGLVVLFACTVLLAGCLSVKAPEKINVGNRAGRIDSSRVPPTQSPEETRQQLEEAYERNRYLEAKVAELKEEIEELEEERDEYKRRYEKAKD